MAKEEAAEDRKGTMEKTVEPSNNWASTSGEPVQCTANYASVIEQEREDAPVSLHSQVMHSFRLYEHKIIHDLGKEFLWLLHPEDNKSFNQFMKHEPKKIHLNYF